MKSYSLHDHQMKPRQQYFHVVLFIFKCFCKIKIGIALNFDFRHILGVKGLKCIVPSFKESLDQCLIQSDTALAGAKGQQQRPSTSLGLWRSSYLNFRLRSVRKFGHYQFTILPLMLFP